jgi:hypothetical protein
MVGVLGSVGPDHRHPAATTAGRRDQPMSNDLASAMAADYVA